MDAPTQVIINLASLHRKLITGLHILHQQHVVDAFGHLSVRHPFHPHVFIMSRCMAPGTVSDPDADLVEYRTADAEPVDLATSKIGFAERHIHSEIYRRHDAVHAVVHSHAESVIPFGISGVPLRPCYHMAGFLGLGQGGSGFPPVYDAADFMIAEDAPDMLVRNAHLGEPLAACFDGGGVVTLMRGHGFTAVGETIEDVVLRAVYTMKNASIQTTAMAMQSAFAVSAAAVGGSVGQQQVGLRYLSKEEAKGTTEMTKASVQRPWKLWEREVEACGLYVNSA